MFLFEIYTHFVHKLIYEKVMRLNSPPIVTPPPHRHHHHHHLSDYQKSSAHCNVRVYNHTGFSVLIGYKWNHIGWERIKLLKDIKFLLTSRQLKTIFINPTFLIFLSSRLQTPAKSFLSIYIQERILICVRFIFFYSNVLTYEMSWRKEAIYNHNLMLWSLHWISGLHSCFPNISNLRHIK